MAELAMPYLILGALAAATIAMALGAMMTGPKRR